MSSPLIILAARCVRARVRHKLANIWCWQIWTCRPLLLMGECVRRFGWGGLPTYLKRGMGPAICFSFWRRSVVFQLWQASEWKLALTSNYILPACQGLWDYRLAELQSAPFLHSHFVIPLLPCVHLISAFRLPPFRGSIILFSFLFSPDNKPFSIFNSTYPYHAIFYYLPPSIAPPLAFSPLPCISKKGCEEWNWFSWKRGKEKYI